MSLSDFDSLSKNLAERLIDLRMRRNLTQADVAKIADVPSKKIPADQIKSVSRSGGEVTVIKLLPDPVPGMEIDKIELNVGARMRGIPHAAGTKEYLHCLQGEIAIVVAGETYQISKGDVLAFPGEIHHSYENIGKGKAVGLSVVAIAPVGV